MRIGETFASFRVLPPPRKICIVEIECCNFCYRYYRVLYKHLLNPEFAVTSHAVEFMNLIFKSMKADTVTNRIISFVKRLLQIAIHVQPNLSCAILFLISEVSKYHKNIILLGNNMQTTEDRVVDESVLKPTSVDISALEELVKTSNVTLTESSFNKALSQKEATVPSNANSSSTVNASGENSDDIKAEKQNAGFNRTAYDASARNPMYTGAELSLTLELIPLAHHYHPSVSLFAKTLLECKTVCYDGNPLKDFTVSRFLERFIYKNPKSMKNQVNIFLTIFYVVTRSFCVIIDQTY